MIKGGAAAIIAAGGTSSRMGFDKLFAEISGIPVIMRAILAFERADSITEIIVAAKADNVERIRTLCSEYNISKFKTVVSGGEHRQESVLNAVREISGNIDVVAVHDGARPFITSENIDRIVGLAREKGAVIPAVRVKDTIKSVGDGRILETPDRAGLYAAQTPQVFLLEKYMAAVGANSVRPSGTSFTDDAQMLENAGFEVFITEGDYGNIKITTPDDLNNAQCTMNNVQLRVGSGYDVHKFAKDRKLILCGVEIPHEEGLLGHSDADVAVHALMDAILGACALGDIGKHFPDTEPEYKGISSVKLLKRVISLIGGKGYTLSNLDITIVAERPKLAPYIMQMRENIAEACKIPLDRVSVKATTEEGLGLGGKGIGAHAVCIVKQNTIT